MSVSFNYIPSNVRVPLFYAEIDNSMANTATSNKKSLLIGQAIGDTAVAGKPYLISAATQAKEKFGRGSPLSLMVEAYRNQDTAGELYCLPMSVSGVSANGKITLAGTALESGTVSLYVGSVKVAVSVASGDADTKVASAIVAAITANKDLPVNASLDESGANKVVKVTAKQTGTYGNDIPLAVNLQGYAGGESDVDGIKVTFTAMNGGTGDIDYAKAFEAVKADTFYYVGIQSCDATVLDACKTEMQDATGRWSYSRMQYGHVFSVKKDTAENLVTFGKARNDQHVSVFGVEAKHPEPAFILAGAITGAAAVCLTNDPARPLQTRELVGIMAPAMEDKFGFNEQNTLLHNGIATLYDNAGTVMIQRAITTYQTNKFGDADNSYLDVTTMFTLAEIITTLKSVITSKYPRHKLASDGTNFGPGQAIVTPAIIKSELIAQYKQLERKGLVENTDLFAKYLIVERNADDPNRLDVLLPPDLVNQLRIFALQAQFRLQYSDNA